MKNKKGISLIVLVITIVVMGILASAAIFISADASNNSKKVAFASDLTTIQEAVKEYYITNNGLPTIDQTSYTKTQILAMISEGSDILSEEIAELGDNAAKFYKIDLSKLPIENSARGIGANDNNTDIYIVSAENFNVYYLKGEYIDKEYYFALTSDLVEKTKINSSDVIDTSNITISNTVSGIKLSKNTTEWTNSLIVNVDTTLEENEIVEYKVAETAINTSTVGKFTIDIASILNANATLKDTFYANETNKVLTVNKYDTSSGSNVLIATSNISLSNLDILSGNTMQTLNIEYTVNSNFRLAKINNYEDLGGSLVKEARVLYMEKTNSDGTTSPYYTDLPQTITPEYVKNVGISFNAEMLKLAKDVNKYAIVFIDNAGNISEVGIYTIN